MEGIELLKYWKISVNMAIEQTWGAFCHDPNLFLTEADVQCFLYNQLRMARQSQPYAVHTEVTHYARHNNPGGYRRRDISLLNPCKIYNNNMDFVYEQAGLDYKIPAVRNKGFRHIGEAIFIEIKFQRYRFGDLEDGDIENLRTYEHDGENTPKYAVLIWVSKHPFNNNNNLVGQMRDALEDFSQNVGEIHIPFNHVFGFVFNPYELYEIKRNNDDNEWVNTQIG